MRRLTSLPLLVLLLGFAGLAMVVPAVHALTVEDHALARAFFYNGLLVLVFSAMLGLARANSRPRNVARNHLVSLAIAYAILPPVLALPLVQLPAGGHGFGAAWFEMVSSFTTTGAATLSGPLKATVELWRAEVGWLGGFFVLVMAFSVLAPLNLGGIEVETGRLPHRANPSTAQITRVADPTERMIYLSGAILPIYCAATLALWVLLMILGEESFFALCLAMSTLSTSGILPAGGLAADQSGIGAELVVLVFLIPALSRRPLQLLIGQSRDRSLWRDKELRLALLLVLGVTGVLLTLNWGAAVWNDTAADFSSVLSAAWGISFTCLSFLTTAGFVSEHWAPVAAWSGLPLAEVVLWALAIIGGGVATTAGGVKLLRVYALLRFSEHELERLNRPNIVAANPSGALVSREAAVQGTTLAWLFFMTFGLTIAVVCAALTFFGAAFDSALVLTLAALTTTGPLAAQSGGIIADFATLTGIQQVVLGVAMVVGRLETLAILAILVPSGR